MQVLPGAGRLTSSLSCLLVSCALFCIEAAPSKLGEPSWRCSPAGACHGVTLPCSLDLCLDASVCADQPCDLPARYA